MENLLTELGIATGTPSVGAKVLDDDAPNALALGYRVATT